MSQHRDPVEIARANPTSLRAAINGKCWECQGGDADPGPRRRIRECEIPSCPLYPVRPYQKAPSGGSDAVENRSASRAGCCLPVLANGPHDGFPGGTP